jgi:hypothetical protein
MQRKYLTQWLSLIAIIVLLLSGCAPRAGQGETAAMAGAEKLAVDMPAIVIDFDAEGTPSVGNVPVAQLASTFGAAGLDALKLPPEQIQMMTAANIQHVQINNAPDGLNLLVNGQEIPSLAWDGQSLANITEVAGMFGSQLPAGLDKLLPVITHLGIGVILKFPTAQGAEAIPTYITGEGSAAAAANAAQASFLAGVEGKPGKISIPVFYQADGSYRINDMTEAEWITLTGQSFWSSLRMNPTGLQSLAKAGVSQITLSTDANGIHIAINDKALPYISWADGKLNHLLNLADQMGLWQSLADSGQDVGMITSTINTMLPMVTASEFSLNLFIPAS